MRVHFKFINKTSIKNYICLKKLNVDKNKFINKTSVKNYIFLKNNEMWTKINLLIKYQIRTIYVLKIS